MIKILQKPTQCFPIALTAGFSIKDLFLWSVVTVPSFCAQMVECGWLPLVSKCQVWRIIQERFIYFSERAGIRVNMRPVGDVRHAWNRTGSQSSPSCVPFQAWQTPHCPRPYKSVSQIRNHSHHFSIMVHPNCKTHSPLLPQTFLECVSHAHL